MSFNTVVCIAVGRAGMAQAHPNDRALLMEFQKIEQPLVFLLPNESVILSISCNVLIISRL